MRRLARNELVISSKKKKKKKENEINFQHQDYKKEITKTKSLHLKLTCKHFVRQTPWLCIAPPYPLTCLLALRHHLPVDLLDSLTSLLQLKKNISVVPDPGQRQKLQSNFQGCCSRVFIVEFEQVLAHWETPLEAI